MVEEIIGVTFPETIDKKERLVPRIVLFVSLFMLINYFILSEIFLFFDIEKNQFFSFLLVFLSFSYVLGAAAIRYSNKLWAKIVNVFGSIWLGYCVIALFVFLIIELLFFADVLNEGNKYFVGIIFSLLLLLYSLLNALFIFSRRITIKSNKIKSSKRIVQISDLHIGAAHKNDFLEKIVEKINGYKPDFVFITGDLIDGKHKYLDNYFAILKNISAPVFMVTGNHERITGMRTVGRLLKNSGVFLLRNGKIKVDELSIIGIDDTDKPKNMLSNLKKIGVNSSDYNILLFHRPKKFKKVANLGVDLMLTGHTHGGQIFPLNLLMRLYYKRVKGLYERNGSFFYVSQGTGWWGPPMRLGSRNEITIFDLVRDV